MRMMTMKAAISLSGGTLTTSVQFRAPGLPSCMSFIRLSESTSRAASSSSSTTTSTASWNFQKHSTASTRSNHPALTLKKTCHRCSRQWRTVTCSSQAAMYTWTNKHMQRTVSIWFSRLNPVRLKHCTYVAKPTSLCRRLLTRRFLITSAPMIWHCSSLKNKAQPSKKHLRASSRKLVDLHWNKNVWNKKKKLKRTKEEAPHQILKRRR